MNMDLFELTATVFFMSIRNTVQTYIQRGPGRDVTWTALVISVYSV